MDYINAVDKIEHIICNEQLINNKWLNAIHCELIDELEKLLNNGYDINTIITYSARERGLYETFMATGLCYALLVDNRKMVKWLIEHGASLNIKNPDDDVYVSYTSIHDVDYTDVEIEEILAETFTTPQPTANNIQVEAELRYNFLKKRILDIGTLPNYLTSKFKYLYFEIFDQVDLHTISDYQSIGSEIFGRSVYMTALHFAIHIQYRPLIKWLLENGADPNCVYFSNNSNKKYYYPAALVHAIVGCTHTSGTGVYASFEQPNVRIVELLLQYGADPHRPIDNLYEQVRYKEDSFTAYHPITVKYKDLDGQLLIDIVKEREKNSIFHDDYTKIRKLIETTPPRKFTKSAYKRSNPV